jgi:4-amino-4-deoxy-L-arabinose transferase-like glycosyltransferase
VIVFLLGVALLLPSVWSEASPSDKDEYWRSLRTPLEMLERESWVTPWLDGEPRLRKPPLVYWAILLSYRTLGVHLLAARLWIVLSGAGLAVCSLLIYRELFGKGGVLAGGITLATAGVAVLGRMALLDIPLAFFTSLAVFFGLRWGRTGRPSWILLSAAVLGLSFLVKGPIGIALFALAVVSGLSIFGRWRFAFSRTHQIMGALVLLLAVCIPWPLAMWLQWPDFLEIVMEEMVGERKLGSIPLASAPAVVGGALLLVFPWIPVFIVAVVRSFDRGDAAYRQNLWLLLWILASAIALISMRSFERYTAPLLPAMCVLCARCLEDVPQSWRRGLLVFSVALTAVVAAPLCVFCLWFGVGAPFAVVGLGLAAGAVWLAVRGSAAPVLVGAVASLLTALLGGVYPSLGMNSLPPNLGEIVGEMPVAVYHHSRPAMLSMRVGRSAVRFHPSHAEDHRRLAGFDGFVFVNGGESADFEDLAADLGVAWERAGEMKILEGSGGRIGPKWANLDHWIDAVKSRSLDGLCSAYLFYRTHPRR